MYRYIQLELEKWRAKKSPGPILLRGARQVGKTYTVEKFALKNFETYIYINFEFDPHLKKIFIDLDPQKIIQRIFQEFGKRIEPGQTLIFLDEVQECPEAVTALRYFYEKMPGLHLIAAGSLLEFLLNSGKISIPVGRLDFLFLQPMNFYEFLNAKYTGNAVVCEIKNMTLTKPLDEYSHSKLLENVRQYFYLGGMPAVLEEYFKNTEDVTEQALEIDRILSKIVYAYRKDFGKYANLAKQKYLEAVFINSPKQIGSKFKYAHVDKELNSQEIKEAYELLLEAGILHKVSRTSAAGLPLGAEASHKHFKTICLDIGLLCKILGIDCEIIKEILETQDFHSIAQGILAEQFVGQELLANRPAYEEPKLYYWEREAKNSSAEVDYLIGIKGKIIPIEVKAGITGRLKSLHMLIAKYKLPFGVRVSQKKLSFENQILSVPLYAVAEIPRLIIEMF